MSKVFLDTNILVYAFAGKPARKKNLARKWLRELSRDSRAVLSTQILQEFYVVATRKMGVDPLTVKGLVHSFSNLETVTITPPLIESAVDISILNRLSFWDALVIAAAESSQCDSVLSEDLQQGQTIRGVTAINPFGGVATTKTRRLEGHKEQ
ncbi:MAG TPA: PIN domain-containing protein [Acidobacteriota bacterium]|nr:PIN domain-containing protein [Acidobacteriota bacterium]